jgi:hypothetical protein
MTPEEQEQDRREKLKQKLYCGEDGVIGLAGISCPCSSDTYRSDISVLDNVLKMIRDNDNTELKTLFLDSYFANASDDATTLKQLMSGMRFLKSGEKIKCNLEKAPPLGRVFIADMLWLFYFEQMGVFKILGVILDDFGTKGKYPISSDISAATILQELIMLTKMGVSSTVRDRASGYQRCLGWTSGTGRKLIVESQINNGFTQDFHKLLQYALEYYKAKQLAIAINPTANRVSLATLASISETINLLQQSCKQFDYGNNHTNTGIGIAWVIVGIYIVQQLKSFLGISYDSVPEYMTSAYLSLVEGKPATISDTNRYTVHKECAENGRAILLSMQTLDYTSASAGGDVETWLNLVETNIERYRTAYRNLTGVDLGAPGTPKIEQQA